MKAAARPSPSLALTLTLTLTLIGPSPSLTAAAAASGIHIISDMILIHDMAWRGMAWYAPIFPYQCMSVFARFVTVTTFSARSTRMRVRARSCS